MVRVHVGPIKEQTNKEKYKQTGNSTNPLKSDYSNAATSEVRKRKKTSKLHYKRSITLVPKPSNDYKQKKYYNSNSPTNTEASTTQNISKNFLKIYDILKICHEVYFIL